MTAWAASRSSSASSAWSLRTSCSPQAGELNVWWVIAVSMRKRASAEFRLSHSVRSMPGSCLRRGRYGSLQPAVHFRPARALSKRVAPAVASRIAASTCQCMVLALLPAFQLAGGQADWESGDQDELSADVAALADAIGLGGAVERERLHLDHEVVPGQQSGDLRQGLHGPAVRAATGHPGPGLAGREVGDGQHLGWLGY